MQNNNQLLETLAQNLGTTVEYLWSVLLKQAPISATIDLILLILVLVAGYLLYRLHVRLSATTPNKDKYYGDESVYDSSDIAAPLMCIAATIWFLIFIVAVCYIPNIINGYFNPEYWALKEILNSVK